MLFEKLNELFDALENEFPYSTMAESFRGHHHLYSDNGKTILVVWYNKKAWSIELEDDDGNSDNVAPLIRKIKKYIKDWKALSKITKSS